MEESQGPTKRESTFPLYSKYFGTHPQDVVDHVGLMKKQMEDFVDAFKKRIEVEMTYSKNLTQVSKSLDKYIRPGTELATSFICSAFKVQHQMRSRQAFELAESIKTEIQMACTQMAKKEAALHKKLSADVKRFYKEATTVDDDHRQTLSKFQGVNRQTEELIITKNIMKYTTGIPQEKKVKMISKTMESIKENKQYEKLYVQSVRNFNKFVGVYNSQIINQLDQAETQVREQCVLQADCIRKLIVAEASLFKNIQYDIVNISTQMEGLDLQKDAESFVEEFKDNQNNKIISDVAEQDNKRNSVSSNISESNEFLVQPKKVVGKSMLSNSLLYVDDEYFSWMLFNKRNKKLRDIVAGVWKELNQRQEKESEDASKKVQEPTKQKEETEEQKVQNENTDKVEQQKKIQQTKEQKQQQNTKPTLPVKPDWSKQLRELIQTFKVQHPPVMVSTDIEKKPPVLTVDAVFSAFMDIMRIISQLWNVQETEIEMADNKLDSLEKYLSEHHLYRLVAMIFIEQYRLQLEVMIKNGSCAKMCSKVLKSILKECQKENDTFVIRGILGLVFTFYWNDEKYKRLIYLNPDVYQCEIWKKYDFWQAAIFENTYEQMALFTKQKGQTQAETVLREKNIIFSQLASFCHYMVMLGITSKRVRLIVGRYCRLYEMTEQQNKDLSKMITNTTKQYKETAFQFSLKATEKEKSVAGD